VWGEKKPKKMNICAGLGSRLVPPFPGTARTRGTRAEHRRPATGESGVGGCVRWGWLPCDSHQRLVRYFKQPVCVRSPAVFSVEYRRKNMASDIFPERVSPKPTQAYFPKFFIIILTRKNTPRLLEALNIPLPLHCERLNPCLVGPRENESVAVVRRPPVDLLNAVS
jgi:hypothetical protein